MGHKYQKTHVHCVVNETTNPLPTSPNTPVQDQQQTKHTTYPVQYARSSTDPKPTSPPSTPDPCVPKSPPGQTTRTTAIVLRPLSISLFAGVPTLRWRGRVCVRIGSHAGQIRPNDVARSRHLWTG